MKVSVYSSRKFERDYLDKAFNKKHEVKYINSSLSVETASLWRESEAVSIFVSDEDAALRNIADTTIENLDCFEKNVQPKNIL